MINELKNNIKYFSDIERFIVILFDEMKIQENLVSYKHTGDLTSFVDLGDIKPSGNKCNCIPCTSFSTSKCSQPFQI